MEPVMATQKHVSVRLAVLLIILFHFLACNRLTDSKSDEIDKSLEFIPSLTPIRAANNATVTVNRASVSYFSLTLEGIRENPVIGNGPSHEGWCIDFDKRIDSNGGIYEGLQLYSSYRTIAWKPLNYFLNIRDSLKQEDPELTFRDMQVVIWSLMPYPLFDLNIIPDNALPRSVMQNGQRNFNEHKVAQILNIVESGYRDFHYGPDSKFAIVIETPADVQTVITVAGGK
jgi:hypothetical protein